MLPTDFAARLFDHAASWVDAHSGELDFSRQIDSSTLESIEIDGYELIRPIGKGGMGLVYLAQQSGTMREVAIKFLLHADFRGGKLSDSGLTFFTTAARQPLARFQREIEIASKLKHHGIATIFSSGVAGGSIPFYVMENVAGISILDYVRNNSCSRKEITRLLSSVCDAVAHAHEKGVIHRDLKPGNILVNDEGQVKVLDFGLAKALEESTEQDNGESLSIDGQIVGTPAYMSPEQARGELARVDTRSDVFSLGVMFFHLVVGELPHKIEGSKWELLRRVGENRVRIPNTSKESLPLPRDLRAILARSLGFQPHERYSSARELRRDFDNYLFGLPVSARPLTFSYWLGKSIRRHWPRWLVGFTATICAVSFGVIWAIQSARATERERTLRFDAETAQQQAETDRANARRSAGEVHFRVATSYLSEGDKSRALAHLAQAIRQDPNHRPARALASMALLQDDSLREVRPPILFNGGEGAFSFFPQGRRFILGDSGKISIYDSETGEELENLVTKGFCMDISFLEWNGEQTVVFLLRQNGPERKFVCLWKPGEDKITKQWEVPRKSGRLECDSANGYIGIHGGRFGNELFFHLDRIDSNGHVTNLVGYCDTQESACVGTFDFRGEQFLFAKAKRDSQLYSIPFSEASEKYRMTKVGTPYEGVRLTNKDSELIIGEIIAREDGVVAMRGQGGKVSAHFFKHQTGNVGWQTGPKVPGGDPTTDIELSADGKYVVSGMRNGLVHVRLIETGETESRLYTQKTIRSLAAPSRETPNILAIAFEDESIEIWNWREYKRLQGPPSGEAQQQIFRITFSPDGKKLAVLRKAGTRNILRYWNVDSQSLFHPTTLNIGENARNLRTANVSGNGRYIFASVLNRQGQIVARIIDRYAKNALVDFPHFIDHLPGDQLYPVFSEANGLVACRDSIDSAQVYRIGTEQSFQFKTKPCNSPLHAMAFSPDGNYLFVGDRDNRVLVYRIASSAELASPVQVYQIPVLASQEERKIDSFLRDRVFKIDFSPAGNWTAFRSFPKGQVLFHQWQNYVNGDPPAMKVTHDDTPTAVTISPSGKYVFTGAVDYFVRMARLRHLDGDKTAPLVGRKQIHFGGVRKFAVHPDETRGVSIAEDDLVRFWDIDPQSGLSLASSPIAITERVGDGRTPLRDVAISSDGFYTAVANTKGVQLFETKTMEKMGRFLSHPSPVAEIEFLLDNKTLFTASTDCSIRFWSLPSATEATPDWFPYLLEAAGGRRIREEDNSMENLPDGRIAEWRNIVTEMPDNRGKIFKNDYHQAAYRFLQGPSVQ